MTLPVRPWLDSAGRFPIVRFPCHYFQTPVVLTAPRAAVLHTTEGSWESAIGEFKVKYAPHFLLGIDKNKRVQIAQCVPIGFIGAALKAHNDLAIVQIEMVGFAKESPWQPDPETFDALASLMGVLRDEYGIPLSRAWPDGDYGRAGFDTPHRRSGKFGHVAGWFAHADIPDNDHWDPGNLNWGKIFARAKELDLTPKLTERVGPLSTKIEPTRGFSMKISQDVLTAVARHAGQYIAGGVTVAAGVIAIGANLHTISVDQASSLGLAVKALGDGLTSAVGAVATIGGVCLGAWSAWSATHQAQVEKVVAKGDVVITKPEIAKAVPSPNAVSNTDVRAVPLGDIPQAASSFVTR